MTESELTAITKRLERLEKENRRMKLAILGIGVAALAVFTASWEGRARTANVTQTVTASKFILHDNLGRVRAWLGMDGNEPSLELRDDEGDTIAALLEDMTANRDKGTIVLSEAKGHSAATITDDSLNLDGHISLMGDSGGTTIGEGDMFIGKGRDSVFVSHNGIELSGTGGKVDLTNSSGPSLSLQDAAGFMATFGTADLVMARTGKAERTSAASIDLFDRKGHVIWQAPAQ